MSDEIIEQVILSVNDGNFVFQKSVNNKISFVGNVAASGLTLEVPTTLTAIPLGDVTSLGMAWFRNLDDTNFVEIGSNVAGSFIALDCFKAGEGRTVRLSTTAVPYAMANVASVTLEYIILQD
jgi:hypothetical protein